MNTEIITSTPPKEPATPVIRKDKPGYPPTYTNKGTLTPSPPGKKKMMKMMKAMAKPSGTYARITNRLRLEQEYEQSMLIRDARRGHHTTRIKRAIRRASKSTNETTKE